MRRTLVAFALFLAFPLAVMAAAEQAAGTESGPPGAGPPGYQAWPGHTMSTAEQAPEKHIAAAAAHEQAAAHHTATAAALQAGKPEQAKEHSVAAEKSAAEAYQTSKDALSSGQSK